MKHFKNVFELYTLDWRRIFKNPFATLLILALIIIPSLYAWFNIAALWDPYSNTSELQIAVYSDDKTANFEDTKINIGDKLIDSLHDNHSLGWVFVDSKNDLTKGVKSGKYYAGVYIPKTFSSDLLSFVKGDLKKPAIEYSVNEKINAIAPKITDKGATTLQETISKEFVATVSKTVVSEFNTIGIDLESNLPSINKLSSMILELNKNLPTIDGYTKEVLDLQTKMPDIKSKLDKANEFVTYLPQVNQMTQKIVEVNNLMPQLDRTGALVLDLQGKIPEIQNAGKQVAEIDQDFDGIASTLASGIDEANGALTVIQEVQKIMPDVTKLGEQANATVGASKEVIEKIKTALGPIKDAIDTGLSILKSIASSIQRVTDSLSQFISKNELTDEDKAAITTSLQALVTHLETANSMLDNLIDNLTKLQEAAGNNDLDSVITNLTTIKNANNVLIQKNQTLISDIPNLTTAQIQERLKEINADSTTIFNDLNQINNDEINGSITNLIDKINAGLDQASTVLNSATTVVLPNVSSLLDSTSSTIANAVGYLQKYQKELPALKQEIHDANTLLNGNMDLIVGGINKAADFYQNDFPELKDKLGKASSFVQDELPGIETDITKTLTMVNEKLPDVEKALNAASDIIKNDWPTIRSGVEKAAKFVKEQQDNVDLGEIIKLLKADANSESDFLANPVTIEQKAWYPIPNYGSASAPFYTALCLWVGGLLFSNIASTDFTLSEEDKKRFSKREQYSARMLSFLSVGFFQALIVALGNLYLLHTYTLEKAWFIAMTIFVGLVFMSILYILAAVFGNLGKGIGIILLVLSISGGGGNFPIQLSGKFFQFINPLLPFTYAVNLLREPVGGIYWPNAINYAIVLLLFGLVFGIFGIVFQPYIDVYIKKLHAKVQESHFFH
ncbi:YhgE/Pip family protein [Carnobacterium gallinarum]|uniref:YhgE/Pip domain-containing protein n=1 Tax=Carnobacterium gallinarum TaxID=2749 RepID=UPI0005511E11|nr:YhgE/Pip domain-containing protein [Carnobacterium gallinarum]